MEEPLKKLIILGASNPSIIRLIEDINIIKKKYKIIGFLDDFSEQKTFLNYPILGKLKDLKYKPNEIYVVNSIGSSIEGRYKTTNYFLEKSYKFENIVHHKINLKYVSLGIGNIIYENSLLHPLVKIGSHNIISSLSGIAHNSEVGDFNFIGPSAYICGRVKIKNKVFIGVGAKILPDLKIDNQAIIAAGALVMKDIPKKGKVKGIPAKNF